MIGESVAVAARRRTATMPTRSPGLIRIADPRVDDTVEEIRKEVHDDIGQCNHQHAALHERVITGLNLLYGQAADSRPAENRLGDNRAREQTSELKTDDGDRRQ